MLKVQTCHPEVASTQKFIQTNAANVYVMEDSTVLIVTGPNSAFLIREDEENN